MEKKEQKIFTARWIENGTPMYNALTKATFGEAYDYLSKIVRDAVRTAKVHKAMITEELTHSVTQRYKVDDKGNLITVNSF